MTTSIIQNGITFNYDNNKAVGAVLGGVLTHLNNEENGKYYYSEISPKLLMALDIDWNGAEVQLNGDTSNRTITNTGELLGDIINNGSPMWAN